MLPTASQPIRIRRGKEPHQNLSNERRSSSDLLKMSQSLGTHAPGNTNSRVLRHMSNVSDIFYAGYLLKRSNRPLVRPLPIADNVPASTGGDSMEAITILRHRIELEDNDQIRNHNHNVAGDDISEFFPASPNLPQHATIQHSHDMQSQEFAETFLGVDSRFGLFGAASTQQQQQQPSQAYYSPRTSQASPTARSSPLQIPSPSDCHTRRNSFRNQTRRSTEPTHYSPSTVSANGLPGDVMEQDHHVWRSKYCVLENGILYFYRHQVDAESAEAQTERQQLLQDMQNANAYNSNSGSPNVAMESMNHAGSADAATMDNYYPWRTSLAMSPMPPMPSDDNMSNRSYHARGRTWQKFVALNSVGAVRSAELEHGSHSFALTSEDEDPLILRAQSSGEMNEWIFQFHRSIASYVMDIMETCSSVWDSSRAAKGSMFATNPDISPELAKTLSPRVHRSLFSVGAPGTMPPSLNHGHGRNQLHRRRLNNSNTDTIRMAQSFQEDPSLVSRVFPLLPHQQIQLLQGGWTPPRGGEQQQQRETSPELSAPQSDYPEMERPPATKPVGRYLPPQLRNKGTSPTGDFLQPTQKYIPPHLRGTATSNSKYVAPLAHNCASSSTNSSPHRQHTNDTSHYVTDTMNEDITDLLENEIVYDDEADSVTEESTNVFKLGGCADPLLVEGSILDPMYIPRKSSKLEKRPTVPFGYRSGADDDGGELGSSRLRFDIGAVSECGIRDSNEDSYIVAGDLLTAYMRNGVDMSQTIWGIDQSRHPPGLFAVFDGHCGDHAARFAAERLMLYIQAHSALGVDCECSQVDAIQDILRKAISQLDDEFCNMCVFEGREWESGATALIAALVNEQLVIANLGDARGVLCRSVSDHVGMVDDRWTELPSSDYNGTEGRVFWKQVTSTHSPAREDERVRIENANGWITYEKEIPIGQLQRMVLFDQDVIDILKRCFADRIQTSPKAAAPQRILQISRVCGELAVSRAIGDRDFKSAHNSAGSPNGPRDPNVEATKDEWHNTSLFLPYPENHRRSFCGDLVSNIPDFQAILVGQPGVSDEFLLLGCDGLWDVMDSDDAVRVARDLLFEKGWSAKQAASRLAELAVHLGSSDNITVIVVRFFGERTKTSC